MNELKNQFVKSNRSRLQQVLDPESLKTNTRRRTNDGVLGSSSLRANDSSSPHFPHRAAFNAAV